MNQLVSRSYAGAPDLNLLTNFTQRAVRARWPQSSYKKVGDVVWGSPGLDSNINIKLWFDGADLVAYGWLEPPNSIEFDIQPGLTKYDSIGSEILKWAENRRRMLAQAGTPTIPKAHAMLGYGTVLLTMASTTTCSGSHS